MWFFSKIYVLGQTAVEIWVNRLKYLRVYIFQENKTIYTNKKNSYSVPLLTVSVA